MLQWSECYYSGCYKGEWQQNRREGFGEMHCANGDTYVGLFSRDRPHGRAAGCYTCPDGCSMAGDFHEGWLHGYGVVCYVDGSSYTGGVSQGEPDGQGTVRLPDGSTYSGGFDSGKLHGPAIMTAVAEEACICEWRNDTLCDGSGRSLVLSGLAQRAEARLPADGAGSAVAA